MKPAIIISSAAFLAIGPLPAAEAPPVSRPLFNGRDLTGWKGSGYIVEDGALVCTEKGRNLVSDGVFANYVLDFDFKLPPGGNNGLGIHYPGAGDGAYTGMELQILDHTNPKYDHLKPWQYHGSLYTLAPSTREGLKPVGEWNHERAFVLGDAVGVELNGKLILNANLADLNKRFPKHGGAKRRGGHIAWLGHGDRVAFRDIRITEVAPAANVAGVREAGFRPLLDGNSLAAWKTGDAALGDWSVENDILKNNGRQGAAGNLWSKEAFGDFTLVFDWRWNSRGPLTMRPALDATGAEKTGADGKPEMVEVEELDSGIYLRGNSKSQINLWNWPAGSGEIYGYRTDASMPPEVRAAATPRERADKPPGEWNRMMVSMKGDVVNVTLNGRAVIRDARLPGVPAKGSIALQSHGTPVEFANIWIKEEK